MAMDYFQKKLYDRLYRQPDYQKPLPDYKITAGKDLVGKKILTIGSGTARDIWYLAADNRIIALDNTPGVAGILRSKGIQPKVFEMDRKLPFKDGAFDLVIAKDILEHLSYPLDICREIRRVLQPDGYAVINVPNHFCLPMRLKYLFGGNLIWHTPGINHEKSFDEWNYMHIRYFTWRGFQKLLQASGLQVIKTYFDLFTLNHYTDPVLVKQYLRTSGGSSPAVFLLDLFDTIFPLRFRRWLAGLNPNLFTGSFYVWVKPL